MTKLQTSESFKGVLKVPGGPFLSPELRKSNELRLLLFGRERNCIHANPTVYTKFPAEASCLIHYSEIGTLQLDVLIEWI